MQTSLEEEKRTPNRAWIHLDVRTKMLAALVVAQIMLCNSDFEWYPLIRIIACILPFGFAFLSGYYRSAVRYGILYTAVLCTMRYVQFESVVLSGILVFISGFLYQFMPGVYMAKFLLKSTSVREFIAAMEQMHMPNAITIPMSIVFRFIPAIREEYAMIRRAMVMRGIRFAGNPLAMLEYRLIPLLMSILNIGNELSVAAVARGLSTTAHRTSVYRLKLSVLDVIVLTGLFLLLAAGLLFLVL